MLFSAPDLDEHELRVVDEIDGLKEKLRWQLHEPRRWFGSLRRLSLARNMQGSNSIEGFNAELDDAAAVMAGEEPLDTNEETRHALEGYRDAMTYVLQLANDDDFSYTEQLLKSLHFMMTSYDLRNRPGLWRAGPVYVQREADGQIVYEGADVGDVPSLAGELVHEMNGADGSRPVVCAAMAHLNLVMIHPFRDGNGRMARCLQSLVLARGGVVAPVFMSVEEYLGRNTQEYYDVLAAVGQGSFQPGNDARPWLRFMLTAHLRQAKTMLQRARESEVLWVALERLVVERGLPDRTTTALYDAAYGMRVRNATYRAAFAHSPDDISDATATRYLRQMVDSGLLSPRGVKRARIYVASDVLREVMADVTASRPARDDVDPFAS
jgi:Fic family protein